MRRKSKVKEPLLSMDEVTARLRGFVLDSQLPHRHEISTLLGCSMISDEVAEREEEESDKRLERIGRLIPLIYAHSHTLVQGMVDHQKLHVEGASEVPPEIWESNRRAMEKIAMATTLGSISQLVDMGILELSKKKGKK